MADHSLPTGQELPLPAIVVTGSSGFIGRYLIARVADDFRLFCMARRTQKEAGVPSHRNIHWIQADISNSNYVMEVADSIRRLGGADFVIHLAGYYDFKLKDQPEYLETNVNGTINILKLAKFLKVKRFIFSSSLAACRFSDATQEVVDEDSPADADFAYAWSKRKGEEMVREYSRFFPCSIIRFAAIFSDWCEYPPLYKFLDTWLSRKWNARIIGGKGESSITYLHINDLIKLVLRVIELTEKLPSCSLYLASPGGTVSHNDLFFAATRYYFRRRLKPLRFPKYLAWAGVRAREVIGSLTGNEPFERAWMMKYIDKKLIVENARTLSALDWEPTRRLDIIRRLLLIIENKKNNPIEWSFKNETALAKVASRPNIAMYNELIEMRSTYIDKMVIYIILSPDSTMRFPNLRKSDAKELKCTVTLFYQLMALTIKTKDRHLIRNYTRVFTHRWFLRNFDISEITDFFQILVNIIKDSVMSTDLHTKAKQELYQYIDIAYQLTVDEAEDYFEQLTSGQIAVEQTKPQAGTGVAGSMSDFMRQLEETFDAPVQNTPDLQFFLQKNLRLIIND